MEVWGRLVFKHFQWTNNCCICLALPDSQKFAEKPEVKSKKKKKATAKKEDDKPKRVRDILICCFCGATSILFKIEMSVNVVYDLGCQGKTSGDFRT